MSSRFRARVVVTAVGGCGVGLQVLKALRMAGPKAYFVVGTDLNPYSPNLKEVDFAVALPPANSESYLEALMKVVKHQAVDVLIPGSEHELKVIGTFRQSIEEAGIIVLANPDELIKTCLDKELTSQFFRKEGFSHPRSFSLQELETLDPSENPVIVKPSINGGGSRDTYIVQTREQLQFVISLFADINQAYTAQEYVGTPDQEYTVGILHDMDGKYVNSIAVKRNLGSPLSQRLSVPNLTRNQDLGRHLVVSSGVSQGQIGRFPEVTELCRPIARALGARGPINIQCRLVGDEVKIFEINPRFSGTTALRAMVGFNEPDLLIRKHLLGESLQADFGYEEGVIERNLIENFVPKVPARRWDELPD